MPLLGKIVVIKRNGADGVEFPLTASCLFGRKPECDIRIQLPQVSKEHCRIELNENKELILTNLSSVNPTCINGEKLQQAERLKHGDLITIIDRSFRFEYPPPPTPKRKRLSSAEKGEAVKVLQDQQVKSTPGPLDKKTSEHPSDTCLKDGSNLPSSLDQSSEASKGDGNLQKKQKTDSTMSPFSELYHMVKKDLASKSPWKGAAPPKSPLARPQVDKQEPKKVLDSSAEIPNENKKPATPKSAKKNRRSSNVKAVDHSESVTIDDSVTAEPLENPSAEVQAATPVVQGTPAKQKRRSSGSVNPTPSQASATPASQMKTPQVTPQKFSADEVVQQILLEDSEKTPRSPKGRRSSGSQSQSPAVTPKSQATPQKTPIANQSQTPASEPEEPEAKQTPRTSPRANAGKRFQVEDVLREVAATASDDKGHDQASSFSIPISALKRKRVSFGSQLTPELFDKRLPPNSPLRRGATPGRRSLSSYQKPQSLLRRASTIGLMGFQLAETVLESPTKNASPRRASSSGKSPKVPAAKTPSPAKKVKTPSPKGKPKTPSPKAKAQPKTPTPAKKTPSPKAKTPSPKGQKAQPKTPTPSSSPATPKTPKSARRVSNTSVKTPLPSDGSVLQTPTTQGRFSITRIATPSPERVGEANEASVPVVEDPQECATPKISLRRSMKASARKTPKSALKSAFEVMRSRRSGASRANLKVVSSWADIVKFGQVKPQAEVCGAKKAATKKAAAKETKPAKPKTPARRLKDDTSTGHADSPATIVVGKAYVRAAQRVGAAPKVVHNVALFKKDMKMDEDLTGIADIFKTPARNRSKEVVADNDEDDETPLPVCSLTDMSVMKTPEESGEMLVSPMSVARTTKLGCYNSEAISRLLQDNQDADLDGPQMNDSNNSAIEEEVEPQAAVQTPQRKPAPSECLTGIKKLMRTPKQKSEPIEDLRGKLLKTPKEPKPTREESFEGVKELLKTPKQKGTPVEDMAGLKRLMRTPKMSDSPVLCATGLKNLMKTPKSNAEQEDDLTGVKQLMQTPKLKGAPVENAFGVKRLMRTPKQKSKPVEEDLTGIQQMMKTPGQKNKPVEEDLTDNQQMIKAPEQKQIKTPKQKNKPVEEDLTGIQQMMKTPKQKSKPVEEDLTGIQQMMKTPGQKNKPVEEDLTDNQQMIKTPEQKQIKTPKQKNKPVEEDLTGIQQMMKTPKQKSKSVENGFGLSRLMKTPRLRGGKVVEDFTGLAELVHEPILDVAEVAQSGTSAPAEIRDPLTSVASDLVTVEDASEESEDKENICPVESKKTEIEAAVAVQNVAQVELGEEPTITLGQAKEVLSSVPEAELTPLPKTQRGGRRGKAAQKSPVVEENVEIAAVETAVPSLSAPVKGRRAKTVVELQEPVSMPSPVRKSARGRIPKTQVEDKEANQAVEIAQNVEQASECLPLAVKPRRGRKAEDVEVVNTVAETSVEAEASLKSPAPVKAKRGRRAKLEVENPPVISASQEAQELSLPEAAVEKMDSALAVADLAAPEPPAVKAKRGRRGKQEPENTPVIPVSQELDLPEVAGVEEKDVSEAAEPSAKPETSLKSSPVPAAKAKRGRRGKQELENTPVIPAPQELAVPVEGDAPTLESVELQPSAESGVNVKTNTRARRGRPTKKETPKNKVEETAEPPSTGVEADVTSSDVVVVADELPQMHVGKSGRGRRAQPSALGLALAVVDEPKAAVEAVLVESEASKTVKSGRGTRSKPLKAQSEEDAADQVTEPEEHVGTVVKNVRGLKRTKQPKAALVLADAQENAEDDSVKQSEDPVVKSVRGKRTAVIRDEPEGPVKRGRRPAVAEVPTPVVKPSRGRRAALKAEQEVAATEEPVKEVSKTAKLPESEPDERSEGTAREGVEDTVSEVPAKRGKGRNAKKAKAVAKDLSSAIEGEDPPTVDTAVESKRSTSKKAVNWNSDLVAWENIETPEPPAAEEEPQQKKSKKKAQPAAKASTDDAPVSETKQPADPPAKGRKGRVARKPEEPLAEKSEPAAEENVPAVRRGRAAASLESKQDEVAAGPKRGRKRKEPEVAEETVTLESLPKRRKDQAAGAEAQKEGATVGRGRRAAVKEAAEETPEVEAEQSESTSKKEESKPGRGKRSRAAQEVDSVPAPPAEDPVSETSSRRGTRGQKKTEAEVPSAPVRRTRRK
ncbi:proliferation marker protein Ki-67 [Salminus brasiliensis]|uniref:proliferation marker protein Ki-67 n=1 Tax=Salminus brasiliensis TaxID=930266 RepID=UPI003B82FDE8